MPSVIRITHPNCVRFVSGEYTTTDDINTARLVYSESSERALVRRWIKLNEDGNINSARDISAIEVVPVKIVIA